MCVCARVCVSAPRPNLKAVRMQHNTTLQHHITALTMEATVAMQTDLEATGFGLEPLAEVGHLCTGPLERSGRQHRHATENV